MDVYALLWIGSPGAWILDAVDLIDVSYVARFDGLNGYADGALSCRVFAPFAGSDYLRDMPDVETVRFRIPRSPQARMGMYEMPGPWHLMSWKVDHDGRFARTIQINLRRRSHDVFRIDGDFSDAVRMRG